MDGADDASLPLRGGTATRRRVSCCSRISALPQCIWQGLRNGTGTLWDTIESGAHRSCRCISSGAIKGMAYFNMATDGIYLVASFWKNAQTALPMIYDDGITGYQSASWRDSILTFSMAWGIWGVLAEKYKSDSHSRDMLAETDSAGDVQGGLPTASKLTLISTIWEWMRQLFSALKNGRHAVINLTKAILGIAGWTNLGLGARAIDQIGIIALISAGLYFGNQFYRLCTRDQPI